MAVVFGEGMCANPVCVDAVKSYELTWAIRLASERSAAAKAQASAKAAVKEAGVA